MNGRPRPQQRLGHRLLVGEIEFVERLAEKRRAAPGDEDEGEVVFAQIRHQVHDPPGRAHPRRVGHRMRRLGHLDLSQRHPLGVAIPRHHEPGQVAGPGRLHRRGHLRGRLAGPDHHGAAPRRVGQVRRDGPARLGGRDGGPERLLQQFADIRGYRHGSLPQKIRFRTQMATIPVTPAMPEATVCSR